eukprot:3404742-Karenia_brevis.AAC.1
MMMMMMQHQDDDDGDDDGADDTGVDDDDDVAGDDGDDDDDYDDDDKRRDDVWGSTRRFFKWLAIHKLHALAEQILQTIVQSLQTLRSQPMHVVLPIARGL